jgi:hypothetical protein
MLSLLFGKPPLLRELCIRVVFFGHDDVSIGASSASRLPEVPPLIVLHVSSSSTIKDVLDRINGQYSISAEKYILLHGRLLQEESKIPLECFEALAHVDEDGEAFRSRLVLCIDVSHVPQKHVVNDNAANNKIAASHVRVATKIDEQSNPHPDDEWEADRKLLMEEHYQSAHTKTTFNIVHELDQIGCKQFSDQLIRAGFSSEVN